MNLKETHMTCAICRRTFSSLIWSHFVYKHGITGDEYKALYGIEYLLSESTRNKISLVHKGNRQWLGKHHTEESKLKIGEASKGRQTNLGRVFPPEVRRRMGLSKVGKKHTPEAKAKISKSLRGNKYALGLRHTAEARRRISEGNRKAWARRR